MSGGVTMVPRSTMSTVSSESISTSSSSSMASCITTTSSSIHQETKLSESSETKICTSSSSSSQQQSSKMSSSRVNIRNKKNLRLKRRPTGVFSLEQPNPSSSASDASDLEEHNFDETVLRNTRANEMMLFDIRVEDSKINSTGKMERKQRLEVDCKELKDQEPREKDLEDEQDEGQEEGDEEDDEQEQEEDEEDDDEPELSLEEQNARLKDQLRLKDLYIKQLEERISRLELKQLPGDALTSPVRKKNK